ncbi:hypothetical protein GCM10027347_32220 [Larkinella harenae]
MKDSWAVPTQAGGDGLYSVQLGQLQAQLCLGFYHSATEIAACIQTTFAVSYHPQGLVKLLYQLG